MSDFQGVSSAGVANLPALTITGLYGSYTETQVEQAAREAHEVNRSYSRGMGDNSHAVWEEAPQWQKDSAIIGVKAVIDDPFVTPGQLHDSWLGAKLADGWVYGEVKDADKKTHPCILPYQDLPEGQRVKDELFGSAVRRVLGMV